MKHLKRVTLSKSSVAKADISEDIQNWLNDIEDWFDGLTDDHKIKW